MIDVEEGIKFLQKFQTNNDIDKLSKHKDKLMKILKGLLKELNNDIDINSLNDLDYSQIWAFIYNNSTSSINNFKILSKNNQQILDELTQNFDENEKKIEKKNLGKKKKMEKNKIDEKIENNESNEEEDEEGEEKEDDEMEIEQDENKDNEISDKKDIFFSMKDLNDFADQFEEEDEQKIKSAPNKLKLSSSRNKKKENGEEDEEDDENNSLYSEEQEMKAEIESEEEIKYNKFFDKPKNKKDSQNSIDTSDVDENEIFEQINEIEEKMLNKKKEWSTRGEILGKERPKDSLLTKAMDFEVGLKAPPIPDREYTDKLEAMIKQRIIDDLFDDPIKKQNVNLNEKQNLNDNELNFDKSKKGLSEIYEEKYLGNEKTEEKADEIKNE